MDVVVLGLGRHHVLQIVAIKFALYDWFTGGLIDVLAIGLGVITIFYLLHSEFRAIFFR